MNAYEKSIALGLTGTDQQIVDRLKMLTVANIAVPAVRTWFREQTLWIKRSDGTMYGPLQEAYASATQLQKDSLDYLHDAVFGGSATHLRTTEAAWSLRTWEIVQLVASLIPEKADLIDSFYALDGGRPYKDLTAEQFAAQRTAEEIEEHLQAVREISDNAARTASQQNGASLASIKAAVIAALEAV